ncbi:hypothetical protein D3C73_1516780 [compost metagenome]
MLVAPVNNRWSNGRREKAMPMCASPRTTHTRSSGNTLANKVLSRAPVAGVDSLSLSITRLPADRAPTSGPMARYSG